RKELRLGTGRLWREKPRHSLALHSVARRPGVVVTGHARAFAGIQQRAFRTVRVWRTGRVRVMRLLPLARLVVFPGRRGIHAVMDPAMPARRDRGRFRIAVVDDPAAGAAFRILAALVVDVAELIGADAGAVTP